MSVVSQAADGWGVASSFRGCESVQGREGESAAGRRVACCLSGLCQCGSESVLRGIVMLFVFVFWVPCGYKSILNGCKRRGADGLPREGHKPYRQAEPWESARRREAGPRPGGGCRRARSQPATPQAPRPARRVAPSEYSSREGRTARRVQGRRHRAMSRLQPSCPRTLPTVTPTLPVARTRISSPCPPVQYREGCYHRRGRHSGHGHSGTG